MTELVQMLQNALKFANEFSSCDMKNELVNRINNALNYSLSVQVMVNSCPK